MKRILIMAILIVSNGYAQQITWQKYYYSSQTFNICLNMLSQSDSGFIVLAYVPNINLSEKGYLFKTDKYGDTIWVKKYEASGQLIATNDNGFAIAGPIIFGGQSVPYLRKFNNNGDTLWTQIYSNYTGGASVTQCKESGFAICDDHFLSKTDATGKIIWLKSIPVSGAVIQCFNGNLFFYGGNNANCCIAALLT